MRTSLCTLTLAASAALAGVGILSDRNAQAQNGTYADFPYQQGSLGYNYYRSAAKTSQPAYNGWGMFGRRRQAARYVAPTQAYRPVAPTQYYRPVTPTQYYRPVAPGYGTYAAPAVPGTTYYSYPTR